MSANQSDLSNSHYNYDLVVAVTRESINAQMKNYLYYGSFPTVKCYWNRGTGADPLVVLSAIQYSFMAIYGYCMPIAGGIYEFAHGQEH